MEGDRSTTAPSPFSPSSRPPPWPRAAGQAPPTTAPPLLCFTGGRRKKGGFSQNPLPFSVFFKESSPSL